MNQASIRYCRLSFFFSELESAWVIDYDVSFTLPCKKFRRCLLVRHRSLCSFPARTCLHSARPAPSFFVQTPSYGQSQLMLHRGKETQSLSATILILRQSPAILCLHRLGIPELVRLNLGLGDKLIKLSKIDSFLEPKSESRSACARKQKRRTGDPSWPYISSISAGVLRVTSGRINQAITTATVPVPAKLQVQEMSVTAALWREKPSAVHSQETRLDSPLGRATVNHQRSAETEHDGNRVGKGQGPTRRLGAETLLGDLGSVGISNGRSTGRRESCQASKEDLNSGKSTIMPPKE